MYSYIIIFLLSSVKYVLGVGYALVVLDNTLTAITMVLLGSVTGVFVFTLGGYSLMAHFRKKV